PLKAAAFGAGATAILQSSSLLMVTMIGLINANLLTLKQAVGVMMGQEIGTTLTGQLVAFDIGGYLFGVLIVGYVLQEFGGHRQWRAIGEALLGIGLIFLGLETMKAGIRPLTEQAWVQSLLISMGHTPILGVIAGTVLTAVIQSSSAMTGLIIALGSASAITLDGAIGLILGANLGTCVTGLLASLRSSRSARRASIAQIIINLTGVVLFFPFVTTLAGWVSRTSDALVRQIANAHTIFNVLMSLILFPFIGPIVTATKVLLRGEDERAAAVTQFLDHNMMKVPSIALTQAAKEVVRTGSLAGEMLVWCQDALLQTDEAAIQRVLASEDQQIDPLCAEIEAFVDDLLRGHLSETERRRCFQLKHIIIDVERVADLTENLAQAGQERKQDDIPFSPSAEEELLEYHSLVCEVWQLAVRALASGDRSIAKAVIEGERQIDLMEQQLRESHRKRMECGICTPRADILFVETLRNLERIGDHADNLGISVLRNAGYD
ncbi:MAG TPA: Na/Pi cotransporter family protein, partial [Anaerolineae bacterium]|nr:Na/Pi cotransporter family protein [Anaerolineae bacterium]